jgi:hypothetical protein
MPAHNAIIDEAVLRQLAARKMGRKQIARHFRCSPITVAKHLRALRLTIPIDAEGNPEERRRLPKVSIRRTHGAISLPAISMFILAREDAKQ